MQLMFTKSVGNFKAGEIRDYPSPTWAQIAASAGSKLATFTRDVNEAAASSVDKKKAA